MKACILYNFEMRDSNLCLDFKTFEVLDPSIPKTYPGDSALEKEKFPQNVKFDESVKMVKFS